MSCGSSLINLRPVEHGPTAINYGPVDTTAAAGLLSRLLAFCLDRFYIVGALLVCFLLLAKLGGSTMGMIILCALPVGLLVYNCHLLLTTGQTLGKRTLGIRVIPAEGHDDPGFIKLIVLREFLPFVLLAFGGFLLLIDILFIFRADRRCLHDLIAGTRVVIA